MIKVVEDHQLVDWRLSYLQKECPDSVWAKKACGELLQKSLRRACGICQVRGRVKSVGLVGGQVGEKGAEEYLLVLTIT